MRDGEGSSRPIERLAASVLEREYRRRAYRHVSAGNYQFVAVAEYSSEVAASASVLDLLRLSEDWTAGASSHVQGGVQERHSQCTDYKRQIGGCIETLFVSCRIASMTGLISHWTIDMTHPQPPGSGLKKVHGIMDLE